MNDTAQTPSRLLRTIAVAARWLLGLLVGAWLLLALSLMALHFWIVPRIGDYRGALEAQATRVIGVPVRIGAVEARSDSLFPTVELRDVALQDERGQEVLRLARVVVGVSPRSLWNLSFEQIYIEQPRVDARRDAQGRLHVAGLDVSTAGGGGGADWFFAQREVVVQGGAVRWIDETRGAEPLLLTEVQFVVRNGRRRHALRLDATPPAGWGERFMLAGQFRQPFLSMHSGDWQSWDGELYAQLPSIDVSRLGRYVDLDARIREGSGGLRLWADVRDGRFTGAVADLALTRVDATLAGGLEPLVLRGVTGRLAGSRSEALVEFSTTDLQFETRDGIRWSGGNVWFQHAPAQGGSGEHGALRADRLDLATLALIADRLPIGEATRKFVDAYGPRGLVERIDATWQGSPAAPDAYQARGRVSGLGIASRPRAGASAGSPGVRGATLDFDATQSGGSATLSIANGALDFPGVFEDPVIAVDQLSAQAQWKIDGPALSLAVSNLRFANADAAGEATANWRTSDPAVSRGGARYPGILDLQGRLARANGARVHRYLPLEISKDTRDYVREAVIRGSATAVDFKVRGDLHDMPFVDPKQGEFRIAGRVADVSFAYVPPSQGAPAWPPLAALSGELVFERAGMQVRNARGRIAGAPGVEVTQAEAQIADLSHRSPLLKVDAQAKGPLGEMLAVGAPLAESASAALAGMRAAGGADYRLRLELPLATPDGFKVQASIGLLDNELRLAPGAPALTQARGTLNFTETGFSLANVQARAAGGAVRIEGGGRFGDAAEMSFHAQGAATVEGLRALPEAKAFASLMQGMTGGAAYTADLSVRGGVPEFLVASDLQGLGLQGPAPFVKTADEPMPLRVERKVGNAAADRITVELGRVASLLFERDLSAAPRVRRGAIGVGLAEGESAPLPEQGVAANLNFDRLDIAAWQALLTPATGTGDDANGARSFLPTQVALRARELAIGGRTLHDVVLGGTREGALWRANIAAAELSGYVEYRDTRAGRLHARLARLALDRGEEETAVESLLDAQPDRLPALDIAVDEFELFGRRLGRLDIAAVNRGGREWRLDRLAIVNPDASLSAQGNWAAAGGRGAARSTRMDLKLDIADSGELLARLGMPDVVRRGRGRLEGAVSWNGSPFSIDYPSLSGQLQVNIESGQFLKADPGIAKLLGVLSLQALPRRLTLDFRDVFSEGFAFDFVRGDVKIEAGIAATNNLQMKGVNAAVLMDGSADLARETQDLRVVVVPEINAGTAALVATAINPAIGIGAFLAQWLLKKPLTEAATQEFKIDGAWADPRIAKVERQQGG
jgi:uncharacterized protein (TIGR02099 family)